MKITTNTYAFGEYQLDIYSSGISIYRINNKLEDSYIDNIINKLGERMVNSQE